MFRKQQLRDIEGRLRSLEQAPTEDSTASLEAAHQLLRDNFEATTRRLDESFDRLLLAVAEGIEKVERKERRIDAVIGRARKELKEHGLESSALTAEGHELHLVDGTGSDEPGLPAVREEVAGPTEQASSVRGVTVEQLKRARSF